MSFIWIKLADVFDIIYREGKIREWLDEWKIDGNILRLSSNKQCVAKKELKI